MASEPEEGTTAQRRGPLVIRTKRKKGSDGGGGRGSSIGDPEAEAEAEAEPLSPASRLFHQPHFNCYIIVEMGIGRSIDVDVVKAGLESTLARHPRFSSLQVCEEPGSKDAKWVRTKVSIDEHVVTPVLSPGQLLDDYVSSLSTTTLDFSRPLWDIHLINLPSSAGDGAAAAATVVLRIHHSLGDGVSLMSLLLACTRRASDPSKLPALPGQHPREGAAAVASSSGRARARAALGLAWGVLVLAWWTLVDMVAFVATTVFLRDTETPLKGPKGVEFRRKRFVHRTVSFDDVRAVKTAVACTVNDVLIGVTSAGLSRYLSRVYGESDDPKKTKGIPANTRIRSTLLVNIRSSPGIHALAEMMEGGKSSSARWGNCLSYILLPFSIVMCEDPLDYVRKAKVIAERKKKSLEAILIYNCAYWIVKIFGIKAASALSHRVLHNTTLSFSNVVGPDEEISFYGHPIVYLAPSVYGHPQALTVHYQTYMNKLTMVLAVDELVISDPERLLDDLEESLKLMKHAAATRSKST